MGEKKTTPITINDTEYLFEDLTPEQQSMVNHVADLDRKISSTQFNLDQLSVGRQAFMNMLTQQLEVTEAVEEIN
tara:strand:- start:596 stop:820 length:225 start_codon:yes stop_codon:yes gene_type:complete